MDLNRIKSFAEKRGFEDVEFLGHWKNFDVYKGLLSEEDRGIPIGLPYYILSDDQGIRVSEFPDEYDEIFALLEEDEEDEEEDETEEEDEE